jgi:hypothetical protein
MQPEPLTAPNCTLEHQARLFCFAHLRGCPLRNIAPTHALATLDRMAARQRVLTIGVDCPKCSSTTVLLAYDNPWKRCYSCQHCQHVWDVVQPPPVPDEGADGE